uniref:putative HNH homing endonuclease n=1 Tax=Massjukichlorella minus TaxID=2650457 RepID=UPI002410FED0|nr:putative HNH homing endonuclease [Massjukichlorella minus]WDY13008.1 putative HNH homing endonuclease [Massjukichlorella minus]
MTAKKDPNKPHGLKGRPRPQHVREAISKAHTGKSKNYPSYLKGKTGPLHPAYKNGKGYIRQYDHKKQAAWIQGVKRSSGFKCFLTGDQTNLECHHLITWKYEPTRYQIENGVPLAKNIHVDFHNKYGRGDTTPDQFEEYCKKYYNVTQFPWRQGNHKPSFTFLEEKLKYESVIKTKANLFTELVQKREHQILAGSYISNSSIFHIRCCIHGKEEKSIIAGKYKKARFGLKCCSSAKQAMVTALSNKNRSLNNEKLLIFDTSKCTSITGGLYDGCESTYCTSSRA